MNHGQGGPGDAGDLPDRISEESAAARESLRELRNRAKAARPGSVETVTGSLRYVDIEGGAWVLDLASGERLHLLGRVDAAWSGRLLAVTGIRRPEVRTTTQVGPVFEVVSVSPLD